MRYVIRCPHRTMAPPVGTNDPALTPQNKATVHSGSCNRRKMVYGLVYDQNPPACATPPLRDTVYEPDLRLGEQNRKLTGNL
jgi:hypothetical protein